MIIVAGWIDVAPEDRQRFLGDRTEGVLATRSESGCIDYAFSPDPIDPTRVRLFERWEDRESLDAHLVAMRARPPASAVPVVAREVRVYSIASSEPLG